MLGIVAPALALLHPKPFHAELFRLVDAGLILRFPRLLPFQYDVATKRLDLRDIAFGGIGEQGLTSALGILDALEQFGLSVTFGLGRSLIAAFAMNPVLIHTVSQYRLAKREAV